MRVGIVSDIHSNASALEQVLSEVKSEGITEIVGAGDIVGYYAQPNRAIRLLKIAEVKSVCGNHDKAVIQSAPSNFNVYAKRAVDWTRRNLTEESFHYLESLPEQRKMTMSGEQIHIVHGSPGDPINEYVFPEELSVDFLEYHYENPPDYLILGHTHIPFVKQVEDTTIINPGSVGQPRDGDPRSSFAVLDLATGVTELKRVEYDIDDVYQDTIEYLPRKLADRLHEGR